jgi:hypothetical protein
MIQTELYYDNIWKQRLRQECVPKIGVEQLKVMGGCNPIYTPLRT